MPEAPVFKVTDTDGTVYWFGEHDTDPLVTIDRTISYSPSGTQDAVATSWKCTRIISSSKADTLQFLYEDKPVQYLFPNGDRIEVFDNTDPCQGGSQFGQGFIKYPNQIGTSVWLNEPTYNYHQLYDSVRLFQLSAPRYFNYSLGVDNGLHIVWEKQLNLWEDKQYSMPEEGRGQTHIYGKRISQILFRGGSVHFNSSGQQLTSIDIYNTTNTQSKSIYFDHSVINSCAPTNPIWAPMFSPTLYLDSVRIAINSNVNERYAFEYKSKFCFSNMYRRSDAWGGVNNSTNDQGEVTSVPFQRKHSQHITNNYCSPSNTISITSTFGNGDMTTNEEAMQAGILKKIIYPTGGFTEFEFGANKYKDSYGVIRLAGGLRVERISYYDGPFHKAFEKIYKYGEGEDDAGILRVIPNSVVTDGEPNFDNFQYSQEQVYVERALPILPGDPPPNVWYTVATETKTTFLPNAITDMFYSSGSSVQYTMVTEYQQDMGTITGKTVYEYDKDSYIGLNNTAWWPGTYLTLMESDWHVGLLKSVTWYRYSNNTYDWIRQKKYFYDKYELAEKVRVEQLFPYRIYWEVDNDSYMVTGGNHGPVQHVELGSTDDYFHFISGLKIGCMLLTSEEESWQEDDRILTQETNYYYENLPDQVIPTRIETNNSKFDLITKIIKYPLDYPAGTLYIDNLKSNYMLDLPVEEITQKVIEGNTVTTSGIKYEYKNDNTGLLSKQYALERGDTEYKEKISFGNYDMHGNPLMITPANGFPVSYLWDYDNTLPIAEIINATTSDIAYTSFEATSKGNWEFQGPVTEGNTPAGLKYYPLSGGSLTKAGLNTSREYILSYWTNNSSPFVISGSGTATLLKEISGWRLYKHIITGQTSVAISGSGFIDELRLYPVRSQMKTFSYNPLTGMTVQCDINNRFTYYEYDSRGRLAVIRDEDNNIIKRFCYNYSGQQEDCTSN